LVPAPDDAWQRCVTALNAGRTQAELAVAVPRPAPAQALAQAPAQPAATRPHRALAPV